ncbi:hypothetical protein [Psychroserpens burtonensis]|nr:hypothetical protein [Psychroserpens burtonensis]
MTRSQITTTAKDYDLPVWLVQRTMNSNPENYIDKLNDIVNQKKKN